MALLDEHPNDYDVSSPANVQSGAQYAAGLIDSVMSSTSWNDSAILFTSRRRRRILRYHVSPQPMPNPDGIQPMDLVAGDICDQPGQIGTGTCDFTYARGIACHPS